VRSLPVDSPALRTLKEPLLMIKDIIRDLPLGFLLGDFIEKVVAKETP
jgi:hypothetical protein